jgi:hypothetical protein
MTVGTCCVDARALNTLGVEDLKKRRDIVINECVLRTVDTGALWRKTMGVYFPLIYRFPLQFLPLHKV